jgi:hypothetical protein
MIYAAEIPIRIKGIPALIGLIRYSKIKGSGWYDDASDIDFHGGVDSVWNILDRRGRRAPWLENKMNQIDCYMVEQAIDEFMQPIF